MKDTPRGNRRDFLKVAGATTAGLMVGHLATSKRYAVAAPRVIGANDRINVGHIGCGGQGQAHIRLMKQQAAAFNIQQVAVCEIYEKRKNQAKEAAGVSDGQVFHDYRKVLENKDVDVVVIASPEHWHYIMATEALQAGKDIYLEKPMTRYVDEAIKLHRAVKKSDRIVQVGSQITSDEKWHRAAAMIKEGKIGKVVWSQDSYCRNSKEGEWNYSIDADASPQNLDWSAFLGPAPKREFDKERYFRWRKYLDYSAGIAGDLFPHRVHPLMFAIGAEWPARVTCVGGIYVQKDREVPDTTIMTVDFPSGHTMLIAGCTANQVGLPSMVRGNKATMYLSGNTIDIRPEQPYADEIDAVKENAGHGQERIEDHEKNFLDCVRSRKQPNCGVDHATPVMVTVGLGELACREGKTYQFDAQKLEVKKA